MKTERLIDTLAHDVAPAPPLASPRTRAARWLLGTLVYFGVLLLIMTSAPVVVANAGDWLFTLQQLAALLMATTAAVAAFALTVPGYPGWNLRLAAVTAIVWLASMSLGAVHEWSRTEVSLVVSREWACVAFMLFAGAFPALAMASMLRKGAPLAPGLTTGLAALATTALASVAACVSHPHPSDAVTFAWHGTAILVLVAMAAAAGRRVLTWKVARPA